MVAKKKVTKKKTPKKTAKVSDSDKELLKYLNEAVKLEKSAMRFYTTARNKTSNFNMKAILSGQRRRHKRSGKLRSLRAPLLPTLSQTWYSGRNSHTNMVLTYLPCSRVLWSLRPRLRSFILALQRMLRTLN